MTARDDPSWAALTDGVAAIAQVPADALAPETRIVGDLNLDSLALTELAVLLVVEFGVDDAVLADDRDWSAVTLGELHAHVSRPEAAA